MNDNTINDDVTMGGAAGALLAGRYRVVKQLGQGGMGSVWLAEDSLLDNREVAIKMLPSVLVSNKRAYNQLKAEALVSLKLTHPNIATVRAFEENNGNPFLVVDYIDGMTLDDWLAVRGRLPEEETVRLLKPVAAALDYAHSKGVIHRDVKPGNVMIAKDGTPYILDFGIAREIQETMTRVTGRLSSGTLLYMSPEQLNGAAPSPAQDVYSLAAMTYECLTGAPPFSRGNVEYQIMNRDPAPLDPCFMRCGPSVMAGLAKSSEERPRSCTGVLSSFGRTGVPRPPQMLRAGPVRDDAVRARTSRAQQRTERTFGVNQPEVSRLRGGAVPTSPPPKCSLRLVVLLVLTVLAAGIGVVMWHRQGVTNRRLASSRHSFEQTLGRLKEYDAKLADISPGEGFRSRIEEIRAEIPCGAVRDRRAYDSAAARCRGLIERCEELIREDACRVSARAKQKEAQESRQSARDARASEDAPKEWNAAELAYDEGERILTQRQFEDAGRAFVRAKGKYGAAVTAATSAREDRKKREQVRKDREEQERLATEQREKALKLTIAAEEEKRIRQAEEAAKPKVVLRTLLNGKSVVADVVSGLAKKGVKTPVTVDLSNRSKGDKCVFSFSYRNDGLCYTGAVAYVVTNGTKYQNVELALNRTVPVVPTGVTSLMTNSSQGYASGQKRGEIQLVGQWTATYSRSMEGIYRQICSWTLVLNGDGTFVSQHSSRGTFDGRWKLENKRLTLMYKVMASVEYRILPRGDGSFELRYWDIDAELKKMQSRAPAYTSLYYDDLGNEHLKNKSGFLGLGAEQDNVETPKIFRRVSR